MVNDKDIEKMLAKKQTTQAPDDLAQTILEKTKHIQQEQSVWRYFMSSFNRWKASVLSAVLSPQPAFAIAFALLIVVSVSFLHLQNSSQINTAAFNSAFSEEAYQYLYYGEVYEDWAYELRTENRDQEADNLSLQYLVRQIKSV